MKSGVSCSRPTCPSVSGRPSFPTPPPPSPSSIAWSTTPTSLRLTGIAIGGALPRPSASRRGRRPRTDGQPVQIPALFHVAQQVQLVELDVHGARASRPAAPGTPPDAPDREAGPAPATTPAVRRHPRWRAANLAPAESAAQALGIARRGVGSLAGSLARLIRWPP